MQAAQSRQSDLTIVSTTLSLQYKYVST